LGLAPAFLKPAAGWQWHLPCSRTHPTAGDVQRARCHRRGDRRHVPCAADTGSTSSCSCWI